MSILLAALPSMTLQPLIHPLVLVALIACGAAVTITTMRSGISMAWPPRWANVHVGACATLRLLALATLLVLLLNPVGVHKSRTVSIRHGVVLLVDTSSSMCISDESERGESISRLARLRQAWLSSAFLERLNADADVRLLEFADESRLVDRQALDALVAAGTETRLVDEVLETIQHADASLGSVVVLTDGRDTTSAAVSTIISPARRRGIAVSSVLVGTTSQQLDLNVRLTADHAYVHEGQSTVLRGEINQVGLDEQAVTAVLQRNGETIESTVIVLGREPTRLSFNVTPQGTDGSADAMTSLCEFRLRIEPLIAESRTDNNESYAFVQVTQQHIRVALFENEPYWDTKYLIQALRNAAEIDLTTIVGIGRREEITRYVSAEPETSALDSPGAPTTLAELTRYDVVVLGRGAERWFPGANAEMLVAYVTEHGGSLVLARGRPFGENNPHGVAAAAALDAIIPVEWGEQKVGGGPLRAARTMAVGDPLSFEGLGDTDLILSQMPGMIAQTHIDHERAASIIWARTDAAVENGATLPAAVATQQAGHGRVLAILVDGLWQWALLPPNDADFDPVFPLFWTRAVRWLAGGGELLPGQSIGLSLSRLNVLPGQSVEITVQTRYVDASRFDPTLTLASPDGTEHRFDPAATNEAGTRLSTRYTPTEEGLYTVRLDAPGMSPDTLTSRFVVHDPSRERLDLSADHAPMIALAHATGGRVYDAADPQALLDDLRAEAVAAQGEPVTEPLWDRLWVMMLLLSLLAAEWFWRRATGQL